MLQPDRILYTVQQPQVRILIFGGLYLIIYRDSLNVLDTCRRIPAFGTVRVSGLLVAFISVGLLLTFSHAFTKKIQFEKHDKRQSTPSCRSIYFLALHAHPVNFYSLRKHWEIRLQKHVRLLKTKTSSLHNQSYRYLWHRRNLILHHSMLNANLLCFVP